MFNKETKYALRGLVYIQAQNLKSRRPGVDEISRETEAPRFYIAKILYRMVKSGFLYSVKGKGGGFFFDDEKPSPTIKELVSSIEGTQSISECVFGLKHCDSGNPCPMHERYAPIRDALDDLVTSETVRSLAVKYANNNSDIRIER